MTSRRALIAYLFVATTLTAVLSHASEPEPKQLPGSQYSLWPGGVVPFYFDADVDGAIRAQVRAGMAAWSEATGQAVRFRDETERSPRSSPVLRVRYNTAAEQAKAKAASTIGAVAVDGSEVKLRIPEANLENSTLLHELGHALGLVHQHQRFDSNEWLTKPPQPTLTASPTAAQRAGYDSYMSFWFANYDNDGDPGNDSGLYECRVGEVGETRAAAEKRRGRLAEVADLPALNNYDYDSIMHYGSDKSGVVRFTDRKGNEFSRLARESEPLVEQISPEDASRVLQYYSYEFQANWEFFQPVHPDPRMVGADPTVHAVGTPALAYESNRLHIFVRGSDRGLYWKAGGVALWRRIGEGVIGSDPAAVASADGRIDVIFVGGDSGRLLHVRYAAGRWGEWQYVAGGAPEGGLARNSRREPLGAGVASSGPGSLDVFVVRTNEKLASAHLRNGQWSRWYTAPYEGGSYRVLSRPAALALQPTTLDLSRTSIKVAFNARPASLHVSGIEMRDGAPVRFTVGNAVATDVLPGAGPVLTSRDRANSRYRLLYVHRQGFLSQRTENDDIPPRHIGGRPFLFTGPAAVATGPFSAAIVIKGRDMRAADSNWTGPAANQASRGAIIEPGKLWVRYFR